MSYILDALRKSETERRQGQIPELGQQVQLIHRPKKKRVSPVAWVAVALILNAGVLAFVFWPGFQLPDQPAEEVEAPSVPESAAVAKQPEPDEPIQQNENLLESSVSLSEAEVVTAPVLRERATIIVPSSDASQTFPPLPATEQAGRVPHLVELPLSFQKSVPDLTFNSHIYSSSPASRRVMINNVYLRVGDAFAGLRVEDITEEGVVLSLNGQRFRVGVVRDWVSPR
ncbi:general secretion pathway protein GspB [Marinobacter sp.]|uniref:general secretion pathway protein GspB n=1 Tax=Marinobacter sp. TaxID=50741 RepID=UPI003A8D0DCF